MLKGWLKCQRGDRYNPAQTTTMLTRISVHFSVHKQRKYLWQTFQRHPAVVQNSSSSPAQRALSISPAGLSRAVGWNRPATRMGAQHLTHFCFHGPPARLCETNSLFSTSRARSMLWRGAHCTALPRQWGHMGNRRISRSPFQRRTNGGAHYAWKRSLWGYSFLHNNWWERESHFIPI